MVLHWSTAPFQALYDAISSGNEEARIALTTELLDDLAGLLTEKRKSDASRKVLESGEVPFTDGSTFKVNKCFIEDTIRLSDQLNIDEIVAAELFYHSSQAELNTLGTSYLDSAIAAYYNRRNYILQIVSFYLCSSTAKRKDAEEIVDDSGKTFSPNLAFRETILVDRILKTTNYSISHILKSFQTIEDELKSIQQAVERSKLLGEFHKYSPETKSHTFRRKTLFSQYQVLGEILYGYVLFTVNENAFTLDNFNQILAHMSAFDPSDIFSVCLIPALFTFVLKIGELPDTVVEKLHENILKEINDADKLAENPLKALVYLVFLTKFIDWCKQETTKTKKYDFTSSVDEPMQKCVCVGAFEQLLTICADTSVIQKSSEHSIKPFYDFRSFLQQHIPKLSPIRMLDVDDDATLQMQRLAHTQKVLGSDPSNVEVIAVYHQNETMKLATHFIDLLVPVVSDFVHAFISNCAFMMAQLRDNEEDLLLSSEDFNLEELTENADLERLYLSIYYLYSERKEYAQEIWSDPTSASYGFLQWASRCNSPLIMSTFSMLLAGLATGEENAASVFTFLQMTNANNTNVLSDPRKNSTLLTRYPSISWGTIYSTLSYYDGALSKVSDMSFSGNSSSLLNNNSEQKKPLVTELGEDSIIYISGFFQVLSQVAKNSSKARIELLESDNHQLFTILTNLLSATKSLDGSIFTLLGALVGDSAQERYKIWKALDGWIFQKVKKNSLVNFIQETFSKKLTGYQSIAGFINLLTRLLQPLDVSSDPSKPLTLCFPLDLGSPTRRPGIWCYIDYLCTGILPEVENSDLSTTEKSILKVSILKVMNLCASQLDPDLVRNASACHIKDLDAITGNKSIIGYIQSHPGSAVLNFMCNDRVQDSLFRICSLTIDQLNEIEEDTILVEELQQCLDLLDRSLMAHHFLTEELIPILRLPDNSHVDPASVGASGLSLTQSFLLHLPIATNILLYAGSEKLDIANTSISIIKKLYTSRVFNNTRVGTQSTLLKTNRLLVMCETVDETIRIRSQFIEQFESTSQDAKIIRTKLSLLEFINDNLSYANGDPTISHFLLGFDTKHMTLGGPDLETTVASNRSLLKSIVQFLRKTLLFFSKASNIRFSIVRICAICLQIILKLSKCDNTGKLVLQYLRTSGMSSAPLDAESNFILYALESFKKVPGTMLFASETFEPRVSLSSTFCSNEESMCTLNEFLSVRSYLLQLTALELHFTTVENTLALKTKYLNILTHSFGLVSGSSKALDFLDVLEYKEYNMIEQIGPLYSSFDYEYIFKKIKLNDFVSNASGGLSFDMCIVDRIVDLYAKVTTVPVNSLFEEKGKLKKVLACSISYDNFKTNMSNYLTSWTIVVQVLVTALATQPNKRSEFVVEVFQAVTPKIDDFLEYDVSFAETLISLCVHLIHVYNDGKALLTNPTKGTDMKARLDYERLFPLFRVTIRGIGLPYTTPSLRSDLYVLAGSYLDMVISNAGIVTELAVFLKSMASKPLDVVCHDSLIGEGSNKITSLVLLKSFAKVIIGLQDSHFQEKFIMQTFSRGNYLLLLIQKLNVVDEIFLQGLKSSAVKKVSLRELIYELTYFKSMLSLFITLARAHSGAQLLLRNDLFSTLRELKFLQLDADLGMELELNENGNQGGNAPVVTISLDRPLGMNMTFAGHNETVSKDVVSLYEIFIPIFQLITSIVITSGPQNSMSLNQAKRLEEHFSPLMSAVLKRTLLYQRLLESEEEFGSSKKAIGDYNTEGLEELSKLFTLLHSLLN